MYDSKHTLYICDGKKQLRLDIRQVHAIYCPYHPCLEPLSVFNITFFMKKFYKEGSYKIKSPWVSYDITSLIQKFNCLPIEVKEYISTVKPLV